MKKFCPRCQRAFEDKHLRVCPDDNTLLSLRDPYRLVGATLDGRYRIDALVGLGGFGAVYRAEHLALHRPVAFKILKPDLALQTPEAAELFESEARTVARLDHPNIVRVFDAGRTTDGLSYLAMEWLDGRTLEEELKAQGRMSYARTEEILRRICAALDQAHAQSIVHRDMKPSNVMLVGADVKVLDFGIARIVGEAGTMVSRVIGTPHYAAPEQLQSGARIDRRTDLYALGIILFEMLSGRLPFIGTIEDLIRQKLQDDPPSLRRALPGAPPQLEQLLSAMMARDPQRRPQTAGEVCAQFAQAIPAGTPNFRLQTSDFRPQTDQPTPRVVGNERTAGQLAPPLIDDAGETRPLTAAMPDDATRVRPVAPQRAVPLPPRSAAMGAPAGKQTEAPDFVLQAPEPRRSRAVFVVGGTVALLIIAALIFFATREPAPTRPVATRPRPSATPTVIPTASPTPDELQAVAWQAAPFVEELGDGVTLALQAIPGGNFLMGSPPDEKFRSPTEDPRHRVTLAPFYLAQYETTQAQWRAVAALPQIKLPLAPEPASFQGDALPVESISWDEAVEFCARLSQHTGRRYRLPSEAEWEYAARAGTETPFAFGARITTDQVNFIGYDPPATQAAAGNTTRNKTIPVGSLRVANAFGLFDLHGNVAEWCQDTQHIGYDGAPADGRAWLGKDTENRITRGGSYADYSIFCRSAARGAALRQAKVAGIGFRVALEAQP